MQESLLDLAFPPLCLHCEQFSVGKPLCQECLDQLEFASFLNRCHQCFAPDVVHVCPHCSGLDPFLDGVAAAFDYIGPVTTLLPLFKNGKKWWLAEGLAGMMARQFLETGWPIPDMIIPVPLTLSRSFTRGYNQSRLLADALGSILSVPVKTNLKRLCGDWSQSKLSFEKRLELTGETFYLKKEAELYDKTILLVDDIIGTGRTLHGAAGALLKGCPTKIYALSLAHG